MSNHERMTKETIVGENINQPLKLMIAKYSQYYRKLLMLYKVIKADTKIIYIVCAQLYKKGQ